MVVEDRSVKEFEAGGALSFRLIVGSMHFICLNPEVHYELLELSCVIEQVIVNCLASCSTSSVGQLIDTF